MPITALTTTNGIYLDQILASSFVDVTVRNLSMFCRERACASLSDEDTTSENIT